MTYLEFATLHLTFPGAAQAPDRIMDYMSSPGASGRLLACWRPEIGPLNKLLVIRAFDDEAALLAERRKVREASDPFGCGELILGLDVDTHIPFAGFADLQPGDPGPYYEVRTYRVRPGGLARLIPEWAEAAPRRSRFSPLLMAAYAADGPTRMTHIWPYPSLDARAAARADAAKNCEGWPTPSGPAWLDPAELGNSVYLACPGSPLR